MKGGDYEMARIIRILSCDGDGDCPSGGADESDVAEIVEEYDDGYSWDESQGSEED